MTYKSKTKALQTAVVLFLLALAAGCADAESKVIINNPTAPTAPTTPTTATRVDKVRVLTPDTLIRLTQCYYEVNLTTEVDGVNVDGLMPTWTHEGNGAFTSDGRRAKLIITKAGTSNVFSTVMGVKSNVVSIVATGDCGGTSPPSPQEPSVDLKVNGSDGPITVAPGSVVDVDRFLTNCVSAFWISGPLTGMVGGNGRDRVTINADTRFGMRCSAANGTTDEDFVQVNLATSTPPPTPTELVISPLNMSLYPTSCPSAGATVGTLTANMAVTWSSSNTVVASVSANGVVTGLNAGTTTIRARSSDGQEKTATVTVNSCPPAAANLQVSPTTLTFQLGGSGCTATGPLTFTATSNQAITLSGWNSSIISVSTSSPGSGSAVTVTALAAGTTTIVVTSGGETRHVTITVNPCTSTNICAGASASLPDLDTKGQVRGFAINAPSGCHWALKSNSTVTVSVNPAEGYGPSSGTVTALNVGTATVRFVVNPGPNETTISSRTYTIR